MSTRSLSSVLSDVDFTAGSVERPNEPYHVIEYGVEEPSRTCVSSDNPDILTEYFLAISVLILGVALITLGLFREDGLDTAYEVYGSILMASGTVGAISAIFGNVRTKFKRRFFRQANDWATLLYLAIAVGLLSARAPTNWLLIMGGSLFDSGLVNFLLRSAYLARAAEDENVTLKEELAILKDSLASGLADGYYENFIKSVVSDIRAINLVRDEEGNLKSRTTLKFRAPNEQVDIIRTVDLIAPILFVVVPRIINCDAPNPFNDIIQDMRQQQRAYHCSFQQTVVRGARVKTFLATCDPDSHENGPLEGYIMELAPTTLMAVLKHMRRYPEKYDTPEKRNKHYLNEVNCFTKRLAWHLRTHKIKKYVRIIEFENEITSNLLIASFVTASDRRFARGDSTRHPRPRPDARIQRQDSVVVRILSTLRRSSQQDLHPEEQPELVAGAEALPPVEEEEEPEDEEVKEQTDRSSLVEEEDEPEDEEVNKQTDRSSQSSAVEETKEEV